MLQNQLSNFTEEDSSESEESTEDEEPKIVTKNNILNIQPPSPKPFPSDKVLIVRYETKFEENCINDNEITKNNNNMNNNSNKTNKNKKRFSCDSAETKKFANINDSISRKLSRCSSWAGNEENPEISDFTPSIVMKIFN